MEYALFINGVFKTVIEEIREAQEDNPQNICYLQPYKDERMHRLAEMLPNSRSPITLYVSTTDSLPEVSYKAKIVGWEDKRKLSVSRLAELNVCIQLG